MLHGLEVPDARARQISTFDPLFGTSIAVYGFHKVVSRSVSFCLDLDDQQTERYPAGDTTQALSTNSRTND